MKTNIVKNAIAAASLVMVLCLASCKGKDVDANNDALSADSTEVDNTVTIDTTTMEPVRDTTAVNPDTIMGP